MNEDKECLYSLAYDNHQNGTLLLECVPTGQFDNQFRLNRHGYYTKDNIDILEKQLDILNSVLENDGNLSLEEMKYSVSRDIDINSISKTYILEIIKTTTYEYYTHGEIYEWE